MKKINLLPLFLFLFVMSVSLFSQSARDANCFSMLVGKNASADASVMIAHNEDDWGDLYVDWHKVPRIQHKEGSKVKLQFGGEIDQVAETWSFFWLQMPDMQFSDSYMNEWGVTIASNQCNSREDKAELTDGGIGYFLRRTMIERAKTAREAVEIGGQLVEQFGYHYAGRTYLIADKNEAWMMAVVKGKHWVAQRVPDDHVAIIPNYYTIQEIDLGDSDNFLGARDIITYAMERGWFDPDKGKRFNFRESYADPSTLYGIWNIPRHQNAIHHFSEKKYGYHANFPFSFVPEKKVSYTDIMEVMGTHGEGSQFEISANYNKGNPHDTEIKRVCSGGNQYGFVAQLRTDLPDPISCVMWLAPKRPCIQAFTPWYIGITEIPEAYTRGNPRSSLAKHFKEEDLKSKTADKAYWTFKAYADACDKNYLELSAPMKAFKESFQKEVLAKNKVFEDLFLDIYENEPDQSILLLNKYVGGLANRLLDFTAERVEELNTASDH